MPTALPAATTAVAGAATEADVKNWITGIHDYLLGLLGSDGSVATAIATLGIVAGVASFNSRTGAVSLSSGDVTTALGFTPPPADPGFNGLYSIVLAENVSATAIASNAGIAGSGLRAVYYSIGASAWAATGTALAGTWRNLGGSLPGSIYGEISVFQRIA